EVLVDDGLRDAGLGGDLLDRSALETLVSKEFADHLDQLLAALLARHARSRSGGSLLVAGICHTVHHAPVAPGPAVAASGGDASGGDALGLGAAHGRAPD